jgi:para-nitrobenzyl esterase
VTQYAEVTTAQGPVTGVRSDGSARFLGIPYAQPPVGDLRFAAPQPVAPWTEPLDATRYGPTAQRRPFMDGPTTIPEPSIPGEGTLNLNVFTPDPTPAADGTGLPVLVWIHGGGYVAGSAASPWYDGRAFNRDGVVLVSLGYRLGIEGFLHLDDAPDNRGVLDWIAALRWVRDNIAAFGGDPAKVTVAGQSAGGGAVQTLYATPSAHGLFRAAISVSGAVMSPQGRADALAVSERFTERTGVPATAAALKDLPDSEILALMDTLNAPEEGGSAMPGLTLAPFADGELIPVQVAEAFANGSASSAPLMLGFTHHEFNMIMLMTAPDAPIEAARGLLLSLGYTPDQVTAYAALHKGDSPAGTMGQALTDQLFRRTGLAIVEARAGQGRPTWLYQFDWRSPVPHFHGQSFHCLDLPFAFDLLDAELVGASAGDEPPQQLADVMHGAWVSFIRDVDPSSAAGSQWPAYTTAQRATMIWDTESAVVNDALRHEREIWQS